MFSAIRTLALAGVTGLILTGCGGSGTASDNNSGSVATPPPPISVNPIQPEPVTATVEFDPGQVIPFSFSQRHNGQAHRNGQVQSAAFANATGQINYPANNASLSGNILVAFEVNDPDGLSDIRVGFEGTGQSIAFCQTGGCGTALQRVITDLNPLKLGLSEATSARLQLFSEDNNQNRSIIDSINIQWSPIVIGGVSASRSAGSVTLGWTPVTNILRYNVYVSTDERLSINTYQSADLAITSQRLALSSSNITFTDLDDETVYHFLVVGINGGGESAFASPLSIDPLSGPLNQPPFANNDSFQIEEDSTLSGEVLSNDGDPDEEVLTVDTEPVVDVENGTLTLRSDGTFDYTPSADFFGLEQFVYRVMDGAGETAEAVVSIQITPLNDEPEALENHYNVSETDQPLEVEAPGLLTNDFDVDETDIAQLQVDPEPVEPPSNGQLELRSDGSFNYTPDTGFSGEDSFVYRVMDQSGAESTGTATITIAAENARPIATNDIYTIDENQTLDTASTGLASLFANDSDPDGDSFGFVEGMTATPQHGQVSFTDNGHLQYIPKPQFLRGGYLRLYHRGQRRSRSLCCCHHHCCR